MEHLGRGTPCHTAPKIRWIERSHVTQSPDESFSFRYDPLRYRRTRGGSGKARNAEHGEAVVSANSDEAELSYMFDLLLIDGENNVALSPDAEAILCLSDMSLASFTPPMIIAAFYIKLRPK